MKNEAADYFVLFLIFCIFVCFLGLVFVVSLRRFKNESRLLNLVIFNLDSKLEFKSTSEGQAHFRSMHFYLAYLCILLGGIILFSPLSRANYNAFTILVFLFDFRIFKRIVGFSSYLKARLFSSLIFASIATVLIRSFFNDYIDGASIVLLLVFSSALLLIWHICVFYRYLELKK